MSTGRNSPEHYNRLRDLLNAFRLALTAVVVAVGFTAVGVAGRVWAFIPAAIAAIFAVVDTPLAWRAYRAAEASELAALLSGNACRVSEARPTEYGVDPEVLPQGTQWCYVARDFEHELRLAIGAALAGEGPRLVMLCGPTKSGKTRAAFHALGWEELRTAWLIVPRSGASVESLLAPGVLPASWTPLVIWLDDLERYAAADASGLHEGVLRNQQCDRPVVLLATVGGRGRRNTANTGLLMDPVEQLRSQACCIDVPVKLNARELARAERAYGQRLAGEIEQVGIGRRMVAVEDLKQRLTRSNGRSREGVAVVRAAIDRRRAGVQRPVSVGQLDSLYRCYLPEDLDPSEELFATGLSWARTPLPRTEISLLRRAAEDASAYEPYDLAVEVGASEWPQLEQRAFEQIVTHADAQDCFQMARTAFDAGDVALALRLLARAERSEDRRLAGASAFNTGVLLAREGDLEAAEAAYRRADERGSLRGAYNLGQLLRHRGDLLEAEAAYRRADERGSPEGAVNLGALLERRGELAEALEAYRRAQERGNRKGAGNLSRLLAAGGDSVESTAALESAKEGGHVTS